MTFLSNDSVKNMCNGQAVRNVEFAAYYCGPRDIVLELSDNKICLRTIFHQSSFDIVTWDAVNSDGLLLASDEIETPVVCVCLFGMASDPDEVYGFV